VISAAAALLAVGLYFGLYKIAFGRVWIAPSELGVVISRVGAEVPAGRMLAEAGERGVRREVLGAGRHFIDPFSERVEKFPLTVIGIGCDEHLENGVKVPSKPPEVGVVISQVGDPLPSGEFLAGPGQRGIQRKVLTPGVYAINPYAAIVEYHPATIIDAGWVGVVTHLAGEPAESEFAAPAQRGVLRDPLPPGLYYLNPYEHLVKTVKLGYRDLNFAGEHAIAFPAADGHTIRVDATVVWGITPADAPFIVKQFGSEAAVVDTSIRPQVESKTRVVGSRFTSREIVEGASRERFQDELFRQLRDQLAAQHVQIVAALVLDVDVPEIARRPIQSSKIALEEAETNRVKTETLKLLTELNEARGAVATQAASVRADTDRFLREEEARAAASLERSRAETKLEAATLVLETAKLRAETRQILSRAEADAASASATADAEALRQQVESFGEPRSYALWRFAMGLPDALQIQLRPPDVKPKGDALDGAPAAAPPKGK
jgi:regulator of protease activity HflC (stomatin/prohibitin superfamily)